MLGLEIKYICELASVTLQQTGKHGNAQMCKLALKQTQ